MCSAKASRRVASSVVALLWNLTGFQAPWCHVVCKAYQRVWWNLCCCSLLEQLYEEIMSEHQIHMEVQFKMNYCAAAIHFVLEDRTSWLNRRCRAHLKILRLLIYVLGPSVAAGGSLARSSCQLIDHHQPYKNLQVVSVRGCSSGGVSTYVE